MLNSRWMWLAVLWLPVLWLTGTPAFGQTLHEEIDRMVTARMEGLPAVPADDAEFLRRAWLDLAGTLPTAAAAREFFADPAADKRTQLIDRLLAGADFPRRLADAVSVMLLERREGHVVTDETWRKYLEESFAANKPWNVLVREIVSADGTEDPTRAGIRWLADGGRTDPHLRTQDFARIFLGCNMQCAQCHDHPYIQDYSQEEYFGLFAFLSPSGVHNSTQNKAFLIEQVVKEMVPFQSVFKPDEKHATGPRLPDGPEIEIPVTAAGAEFLAPPQDGLPGRPKFQPRRLLAEQLTASSYRQFARTTVNRFWFQLLGRGLVHPLDLDHSGNPPSHPELLDKLTIEFISHQYDVRWLLREIMLSSAYQRDGRLPVGTKPLEVKPASYRVALTRPLSAEQLARATAQALGHRSLLDEAKPPADGKFTFKDYVNGRLPLPANWQDLFVVFGGTFGHPAGQPEQDFRPSVEQSLFLENDRLIRAWLESAPGSLTERLSVIQNADLLADELYLTLLTRLPTTDERSEITVYFKDGDDRRATIQDLCAGILGSAEYRLNH